MRLIDADAAIDAFKKLCDRVCVYSKKQRWAMCGACQLANAFDVIDNMPTVDAVEVIHCEHCRHHENDSSSDSHWCFVWETFTDNHVYCSFAERREDDFR